MIYIYKLNINDVLPTDYEKEYCCLSPSERQRLSVYKGEKDKKRSLATKILLRKAVTETYGVENFTLNRAENGKPFLDFAKISLSHSGDIAVCAISSNDVGIDIEKVKEITPRQKYKFFTKEETDYVNSLESDINIRFLEVWTRKEALFKCCGLSLLELSKTSVLGENKEFSLKTELSDGYIISVCEQK